MESVLPLSDVRLPGRHNLENIAAAILMARDLGTSDAAIASVVATFGGVVHRLEYVCQSAGVTYINNSMCTNVDAFARSLDAVAGPKVVIAGGVFKGANLDPIATAVRENDVRSLVLIGRSAPDIESAVRTAGFTHVKIADRLSDAVELASMKAEPGDTVMLAPGCASFDMFRDFEDRGDQFKAIVRELCAKKQ